MAAYLQQILTGLAPLLNNGTFGDAVNATMTPTASPVPLSFPTDLSSLMTLLASLSALGDWVKFIVIGGFFETCRRLFSSSYSTILESFYLHASFDEDNSCYEWMMVWLSKQPSWAKARNVEITTHSYGVNASAIELIGPNMPGLSNDDDTSRKLTYLPSLSTTYSLWYKRHYMTITRSEREATAWGRGNKTLHISILARHHSILLGLLQEARKAYIDAQEHSVTVFASDSSNNWRTVSNRAKRSLDSIILDPGMKELLLEDAQDFLKSKDWYCERGIPFRRGYLLHGVPGAGKTSIIHSLAGELNLDIYIISLSRAGLDDSSLDELINELPERCIALMEDIDAAFTRTLNRDEDDGDSEDGKEKKKSSNPPPPVTSRVSLSGLLNALDGIGAQEGRILFATTNKYTSLDAALCRPGRMDIHVEFKLSSKYQTRELFKRFYIPKKVDDDDDQDDEQDSGYCSKTASEAGDSAPSSPASDSPLFSAASSITFVGSRHSSQGPKISRRQVEKLADAFADVIPEREFSMASLQGYLMTHKLRPVAAVDGAAAWVKKEMAERAQKSSGKS
ncbi:P-loop containing nucleoside triphosphate hydrolase protein [Hymenopellis radicata]|nr:P-loop containing nucleoside triphosphate hydrolase protein [Hymenopellis radicata]